MHEARVLAPFCKVGSEEAIKNGLFHLTITQLVLHHECNKMIGHATYCSEISTLEHHF